MNLETKKFSQKLRFSDKFLSEISNKRLFAQLEGQMNNEEVLKVSGIHTLEAVFHAMTVTVSYRKDQKQLKILFPV